ncbi:MAG: AAA family ATPase, partial [Campylobacterota bacterium]|nr:AAA family ATPase [Campylobacterota bacterium]
MKKLPLGITTFADIRDKKENYLYVDKTDIALKLIEGGRYYFLSRPRRFGKSLFLDTLSDIFKGKKELFEGLYIYDKWDWEESYPII